jgi:hypothetical protein
MGASAYCTSCGAVLDGASGLPNAPQEHHGGPEGNELSQGGLNLPLAGAGGSRCSNCGAPTVEGQDRCSGCGPAQPLAGPTPVQVPEGPTPVPPSSSAPWLQPVGPAAFDMSAPYGGLPPISRRTLKPWMIALPFGAVVLLVVGFLVSGSEHTLRGSLTVYDSTSFGCNLSLGYSDIHDGTRVVVMDSEDDVIASGTLDEGSGSSLCEFSFEVDEIPDRDEYWVEIGNRTELHYTRSELEDDDWKLALTLGRD